MLRTSDRKPVHRVMVDHVGNVIEWFAELPEDELPSLRTLLDPHVHEATRTSATQINAQNYFS